jgi:DNA-binding protein YbaB
MFAKVKGAYKLQKQAKEIKKDLKNIHIEAEQDGATVTVNGEMDVVSVSISDDLMQQAQKSKRILEDRLEKAFNKGKNKAQQIAAENESDHGRHEF